MQLLKKFKALYGNLYVFFVGNVLQLFPVKATSLFQEDTVQFGVISNDIPHTSHIIDIDPVFGDIVIKLRSGTVSKKDIQYINTRYVTNSND